MKISVINYSFPVYNLATEKMRVLFTQQGHTVLYSPRADIWSLGCDKAYLSCIFTYDLPGLIQDVEKFKAKGIEVEIGGPAVTAMAEHLRTATGLEPHVGIDERFEYVQGTAFKSTFTSRGCPRACAFCLVFKLEGRRMVEYDNFNVPVGVNPYICDNNLLATSWEHQKLVVERLRHVKNLDINSGFDCRIFARDPQRYFELYRDLDFENWRFAYDKEEEREPVGVCAAFLHTKNVNYRNISVYCLQGFDTTFEEGRERLEYLKSIGTSPYPMCYKPLDLLAMPDTPQMKLLFGYYGVPFKWRSHTWEEYLLNPNGKNEAPENQDNFLRRLNDKPCQS